MILLNTKSEPGAGSAIYFLAQHMPDPMRKETRNIGVLVHKGDSVAAKFLGEQEAKDEIDGRALRGVGDARLYRMWIEHWREAIEQQEWMKCVADKSRITYRFIPGGSVEDTGLDSVDSICAYLFSTLVSSGGLAEALSKAPEDEDVLGEIKSDVAAEFRKLKIMKSVAPNELRHPVLEGQSVEGTKHRHDVTFFQSGGQEDWVYEPLNLATNQKKHAKERAGYLSYIFSEFKRKKKRRVNTVAIVRVPDEQDTTVKYAMSILRDSAEIVPWNEPSARNSFLNACNLRSAAA